MAENIGEVIRRLRKERDLTQEELAENIGVTSQAISKWENSTGMPDISQIVPLANFFGVSTDTLFDFCCEDKMRDLEEYQNRTLELRNKGKVSEAIALRREALAKYPGDYGCMYQLANELFAEFSHSDDREANERIGKEGIALCEKILAGCTDQEIRSYVIQLLTYWYSWSGFSFADEEKAVSYAKTASSMWVSSEILLESAYFTEEGKKEAVKIREQNLINYIDQASMNLARYTEDPEDELRNYRAALTLWQTIIPDGNFIFYHQRIYRLYNQMARCHARMGNKNETLDALQFAAFHAEKMDSVPEGIHYYTSPFISHAAYNTARSCKNYTETEYELFLNSLGDSCYDFIRNDPEFIALTKR